MLNELLERYWSAAYAEGKEGRNYDTEDGIAQQTLSAIHAEVRRLVTEEREALAQLCAEHARMVHALATLLGETEDSDYMSAADQRAMARRALPPNSAIQGPRSVPLQAPVGREEEG